MRPKRSAQGLIVVIALLLTGCGGSVESYNLAVDPTSSGLASTFATPLACQSNLGAYALPDYYLKITVSGAENGPFDISIDVEANAYPDGDAIFCLDYLHSPFGQNDIAAARTPNGLLTRVFTQFDSQTVSIAGETINAAATLVSAGASASLARSGPRGTGPEEENPSTELSNRNGLPFSVVFDPFDEVTARSVNSALREYGYCVYFDNRNDPRIPAWWPRLCRPNAPVTYYSYPEDQFVSEQEVAQGLSTRSILHRPEISHRLVVMRKMDPDDPHEPWVMAGSEHVLLPNRAPIMALGVTRGLFADAETTIEFDNGILANVDIQKPSEIDALVQIPIYAVNAILAIPARTLALLQNDLENRQALIASNAELIETLRSLDNQVQRDRATAGGASGVSAVFLPASRTGVSETGRSGQNCLDDDEFLLTPGGVELCRTIIERGD